MPDEPSGVAAVLAVIALEVAAIIVVGYVIGRIVFALT